MRDSMLAAPLQFIIAMGAHAINDRLGRRVEYVQEEVRVLKEARATATGKTRIAFTVEQRRRLALKGKQLTAEERRSCCQIVRPETILAWFRQLAADNYDSSKARRVGRPRKASDVRELVLDIARDNPGRALNLLDPADGFLRNASHLIHDRDPLFTTAWRALLATGGVTCVPIPSTAITSGGTLMRWRSWSSSHESLRRERMRAPDCSSATSRYAIADSCTTSSSQATRRQVSRGRPPRERRRHPRRHRPSRMPIEHRSVCSLRKQRTIPGASGSSTRATPTDHT